MLASAALLGTLALIGYPAWVALTRLGGSHRPAGPPLSPPIGVCCLLGVYLVSTGAWRAFEAGIKLGAVYRGLLIAAVAFLAVRLALALRRSARRDTVATCRAACRALGPDLATFCACSAAYAGVVCAALAPGELAWPTILNADIFVYMKAAGYLGLAPGGTAVIGSMDLRDFAERDVFGAFGLLTFARFALRSAWSTLPLSTMGFAVGLIGMAAGRCCRTVFGLGLPTSVLLALVLVTGPLFQYVALNYFLGQMVFVGILLTSSLWMVEAQPSTVRATLSAALVVSVAAGCVLLCYDVWAFQFVAVASGLLGLLRLFGLLHLAPSPVRWRAALPAAVASGAASAALALACMAATSPARLAGLASKLASFSVPNAAGWPLPFIDPGLLFGLPVAWRGTDAPRDAVAGPVAVAVLLLAAVGIASAKLDRGPASAGRKAVFGLFCASAAAYLAVWTAFGETYQQWKFASTLPLGFGFAAAATLVHALRLDLPPLRAAVATAAAAAFLAACVALNVSIAHDSLTVSLAHLPKSLMALAGTDAASGEEPVYVDVGDFYPRMAALALVNRRPLTFAGHSQFGPGRGPPAGVPYLRVRASCDPVNGPPVYRVDAVAPGDLPVAPLGRPIELSRDVAGCLSLEGFGDPEPWGRRSLGRHAAIRFDCGCDLAAGGIEVVLRAGGPDLPGLTRQQVADIAVDGSAPRAFRLDATGFGELVLPVRPARPGAERPSRVDVEIDLPDAAPRPGAAPDDGMLVALSLVSVEVRRAGGAP